MNLAEYQTTLETMETLLDTIRKKGIFADNITYGAAEIIITSEYHRDSGNYIGATAKKFLSRAAIREVDVTALKLLRLADSCGVDIIDDLIKALPKARSSYVAAMQATIEDYLGEELK